MNCPRCGYPVMQGSTSCPQCQLVFSSPVPPAWQPPPPPGRSPVKWMVALGVAAALVVALAVPLIFLLVNRDGGDDGEPAADPSATVTVTETPTPSETATAVESETATPSESPTTKPKKRTAVIGPGDVRDLPAGLFCRDLMARGYSYVAAVDYWRNNGQPNQMDVERNGIPCETVYPSSDVQAYWGVTQVAPSYVGVETLPAGLLCRDVYGRGYTYGQAVDYWAIWGYPDRMDEDLNGIPCETVFPWVEVSYYWYG